MTTESARTVCKTARPRRAARHSSALGIVREDERHRSDGWLTDVLERVVSGRTKAHELHTLLPWNWEPINVSEIIKLAA